MFLVRVKPLLFALFLISVLWGCGLKPSPLKDVVGDISLDTPPSTVSSMTIAAGESHACALLPSGRVQCWGNNRYGQLGNGTAAHSATPVEVSHITAATAITAGGRHSCAILSGGTVQCWGNNAEGQLGNKTEGLKGSTTPIGVDGITNSTAITAGFFHTCVLLLDSTIKCWGKNNSGQLGNGTRTGTVTPVEVSGARGATAIAAGAFHNCAILSDGTVQCWGWNPHGQLGNDGRADSSTPIEVRGITTAIAIAAGWSHTCIVLLDSTVHCWGKNENGQLGDGTSGDENYSTIPIAVRGITAATGIAVGWEHTCALLSSGKVHCWGYNGSGQLGNGSWVTSTSPQEVAGITNATAIAANNKHTCAFLVDSSIKCWGSNSSDQLGYGGTNIFSIPHLNYTNIPIKVGEISTPTAIAAGKEHTCTLLSSGKTYCWGSNKYGQLGIERRIRSTAPTKEVPEITTATTIVTGGEHTCSLLSNGNVQCWGNNTLGQLGNGTTETSTAPVEVRGITTAIAIGAGNSHTCALLSGGTIQCWGENTYGQLGHGVSTVSPISIPVGVIGITSATAIAVGYNHTCGLLSDNTVQCWGQNSHGQLGSDTTTRNRSTAPVDVNGITAVMAIAAGRDHTCVLLLDGKVHCWGNNLFGQLGNGTTANSSTPVEVGNITRAIAIGAGISHTCALLLEGTIRCWGKNKYGQLGDGTTTNHPTPVGANGITNGKAITAGYNHMCALLLDSTMHCWGENSWGQLGYGTSGFSIPAVAYIPNPVKVGDIPTPTAIAVGGGHACTLFSRGTVKCWGDNEFNQLGNEHGRLMNIGVGTTTAIDIAAGGQYSCALLLEGIVQCWGRSIQSSYLETRGTDRHLVVTTNTRISFNNMKATAITVGGKHACALLSNSTIQCWGSNRWGELGHVVGRSSVAPPLWNTAIPASSMIPPPPPKGGYSTVPLEVTGITTAIAITAGYEHTCALLLDSTVQCWGHNSNGQLGSGKSGFGNYSTYRVEVGGIDHPISITAGGAHTCALLSDGTVRCWGDNRQGQLGDGTRTSTITPVRVSGIATARSIAAGHSHTCALLSDSTVQCWGNNFHGEIGSGRKSSTTPMIVSRITAARAIAAGFRYTCALLPEQKVDCWGDNKYDQLGKDRQWDE